LAIFIVESFELPVQYENVKDIRFSGNEPDSTMFVVTTGNGIAFGEWVGEEASKW
jgi:hypothetical protein